MNAQKLAIALMDKAALVRDAYEDGEVLDMDEHRDIVDLIKVLARIVDGVPLAKAFGAPGDWGYDTPIGSALSSLP